MLLPLHVFFYYWWFLWTWVIINLCKQNYEISITCWAFLGLLRIRLYNAAVYNRFEYWFIVCLCTIDWSVIFVNVININHRLLLQSFIHSALRLGPEHLIQHFRILLAIISYEHKLTCIHTGKHSWKWFDNEKEIKCMLSHSLIHSHTLGGSSCCCHLGLYSSAKHPFPQCTVPLAVSLSLIWCDMLQVCVHVRVCLCLLCIFQRELHIAGNRTGIPWT